MNRYVKGIFKKKHKEKIKSKKNNFANKAAQQIVYTFEIFSTFCNFKKLIFFMGYGCKNQTFESSRYTGCPKIVVTHQYKNDLLQKKAQWRSFATPPP